MERGGRALGCVGSTTLFVSSWGILPINGQLPRRGYTLNLYADDTRTLPLPLITRFSIPSTRLRHPPIGIHSWGGGKDEVPCLPPSR